MEDELLIKIINKRIELNGYISRQAYEFAAKCVTRNEKNFFILHHINDIKFPIQFVFFLSI
jgi:hypothetical protein